MVCVWYGLIMFFVFKQKTAYEMRISDWSSDVCSSDLRLRNMTALKPRATGSRTQEHPSAFRARISAHRSSAANASRSTAAAAISPKIGRASCRERVCQYRVDLGGRRLIKKKKTESKTHENLIPNTSTIKNYQYA